jgi:hypothetical protein
MLGSKGYAVILSSVLCNYLIHLNGVMRPVLCVCAFNKYPTRERGTPECIFLFGLQLSGPPAQIKRHRNHIPRNTDLYMSLIFFPTFIWDVYFSQIKNHCKH